MNCKKCGKVTSTRWDEPDFWSTDGGDDLCMACAWPPRQTPTPTRIVKGPLFCDRCGKQSDSLSHKICGVCAEELYWAEVKTRAAFIHENAILLGNTGSYDPPIKKENQKKEV